MSSSNKTARATSQGSASGKTKIKTSQQLVELYESLDEQCMQSLSDYADFLLIRSEPVIKDIPAPEEIPRPDSESVVGAIKRLKLTYHMIDSMSVFSKASALMTDHMVKGRDATEVIDEMEALFEEAYAKLTDTQSDSE